MKEPTYRQSLRHAWDITWNHKLLWLFGLFSMFVGQMGLMDLFLHIRLAERQFVWFPTFLDIKGFLVGLVSLGAVQLSVEEWSALLWMLIVIVCIVTVAVFVSITSQGALIHGINAAIHNKRRNPHKEVTLAWHAGVRHFWKLLGLQVIRKAALVLASSSIAFGLIFFVESQEFYAPALLFWVIFLLAIFVGGLISILSVYAACYIMLDEQSLWQSIHHAWKLTKAHWLVSLEVGVIVLLVNAAAIIITLSLFLIFVAEMAVLWALSIAAGGPALWAFVSFLAFLLFGLLLGCIASLVSVFSTSVWTYLFSRMHKDGLKSRILHLFGR